MEPTQNRQLIRRFLTFCFGIYLCALGATTAVSSGIGLPPIGSFPYVVNLIVPLTFGTVTALIFLTLITLQILILRREYKWFNLAQVASGSLMGAFIDLNTFLLGDFQLPTYFGQLAMAGASILFIATGIVVIAKMQFIPLPVEGLCGALHQKTGIAFHHAKIGMDCTFTTIAIVLSLLFLGGLYGVREGTILSALLVGKMIPHVAKVVTPVLEKLHIRQAYPF